MPTKTEQGDLLMALYGRHGESPLPIVAAATPGECFDAAIEAVRIAVKYRTPGGAPGRHLPLQLLRALAAPRPRRRCPRSTPAFATETNHPDGFLPYVRDENLARPWAVPGTPGLRHRIGGLEKEDGTGNISYDPENHEHMTRLRAERVERIAADIPDLVVDDPDGAELLVLGWGSSYGAVEGAARRVRRENGLSVATAHLRHLNPLPRNTGEVLKRYPRVLVPEMNMGQLAMILRARFLVDVESYTKVDGLPIFTRDVMEQIIERIADDRACRCSPRRTSPPTRRRAGARAAATTRSSPRSRASCPSWASRRRRRCSSPASAAPGGSSTTWTPTGCTASTAARPRWPRAWPRRGPTSRCGSSRATATRCRSAATT